MYLCIMITEMRQHVLVNFPWLFSDHLIEIKQQNELLCDVHSFGEMQVSADLGWRVLLQSLLGNETTQRRMSC